MILNRDCFFYKKSDFINRLPDISEESICYIADTQQIYVQGRYFECNVTRDIVEQLIQSKGYLTPSDLPVLTGGAAPTSGEYVSGVSVGGHTVNVQKGKFSEINAGTASKLETPREIALSGDASGSIEFDGSQDVVIETTVHNSTTADRLTTPRTISLDDQATGQVSFDGSGDVTIPVTVNQLDSKNANNNDLNDLVTLNGYVGNLFYSGGGNTSENKPDGVDSFGLLTFKSAAGNYSTQILGSSNRLYTRSGADASLGSWRTIAYLTDNVASATKLQNTRTFTISDGTHSGTSSNFDGTGNVTLRLPTTINADINGDITGDITGNVVGNVTGDLYGNADTASKLENSVDISLSGDVRGSVAFDGSENVTINTTVENNSHTHVVGNLSNLHSSWDDVLINSGVRSRDVIFNGTNYPVYTAAANTSDITWYAPTGPGTSGYVLQSTGGTPKWTSRATLQHELLTANQGCTAIPANADLNDYTTPGVYYCSHNATVATWSNSPTDYACSLTVLDTAGYIQILREYGYSSSAREFTRRYYNGTWTSWVQTPRMSDVYTRTDADSRYVNVSGDTMTGPLNINSSSEALVRYQISGSNKAATGYLASQGAYLYSWPAGKYLHITDAGSLLFGSSTVWHSGNDGSGSGLDADLLDGYQASSFLRNRTAGKIDFNTITESGIYRLSYTTSNGSTNGPSNNEWGQMLVLHGSGDTIAQLSFGCTSGTSIKYRAGNPTNVGGSGSWNSWKTVLDSSNYSSYTVTQTGVGASGTWKINITGSAGSVDWGNVEGKPSTFTPSSHTHATSSITSLSGYSEGSSTTTLKTSMTLNEALASLQNQIQTKQAAGNYAAASHNHSASAITSGKLAIDRIPTGTTSSTVALGDHGHSNATTSAAGFMSAADKTKLNNTPTFSYSGGILTITT